MPLRDYLQPSRVLHVELGDHDALDTYTFRIDSVTDGHDAGADDAGSADAASAGRTGGDPDAFVRAHVDGLLDRAVTRYGHPASTRIVTARGGIRTAIEVSSPSTSMRRPLWL